MYGKVDPGARQPYRCTIREKGILPGCKFFFFYNLKIKNVYLVKWLKNNIIASDH